MSVAERYFLALELPALPLPERLRLLKGALEEVEAELGIEAERAWAAKERRAYRQAELAADSIDRAVTAVAAARSQLDT